MSEGFRERKDTLVAPGLAIITIIRQLNSWSRQWWWWYCAVQKHCCCWFSCGCSWNSINSINCISRKLIQFHREKLSLRGWSARAANRKHIYECLQEFFSICQNRSSETHTRFSSPFQELFFVVFNATIFSFLFTYKAVARCVLINCPNMRPIIMFQKFYSRWWRLKMKMKMKMKLRWRWDEMRWGEGKWTKKEKKGKIRFSVSADTIVRRSNHKKSKYLD